MKRCVAWCAVVLLPVCVIGFLLGVRRDLRKPNWSLPTQMAVSPAYKTQSTNPVLPGGVTMQTPPPGTLPRGFHPFRFENTDADRLRAGRELANPFPPSADVLQRGRYVYETFCGVCHGPSGRGDGSIIPAFPNPPDFTTKQSRELTDGEMFHIITLGRKKMPGYASQVPWDDRWRVIVYVRSLQEGNE